MFCGLSVNICSHAAPPDIPSTSVCCNGDRSAAQAHIEFPSSMSPSSLPLHCPPSCCAIVPPSVMACSHRPLSALVCATVDTYEDTTLITYLPSLCNDTAARTPTRQSVSGAWAIPVSLSCWATHPPLTLVIVSYYAFTEQMFPRQGYSGTQPAPSVLVPVRLSPFPSSSRFRGTSSSSAPHIPTHRKHHTTAHI